MLTSLKSYTCDDAVHRRMHVMRTSRDHFGLWTARTDK